MVDAWMVRGYMTAAEVANISKALRNSLATATGLYARAYRRVHKSPRLRKYADIILDDWPEGDDHLRWVIRGRVGEIEQWAKQIKEDSDG